MIPLRREQVSAGPSRNPSGTAASAPGEFVRGAEQRIVRLTLLTAVALVAFQTAAHLTNALLLDYRVWNLNADVDANALSWLSSMSTLAAALGAGTLALARIEMRGRLAGLALVLAFFSLDDIVAIHEAVGEDVTAQLPVADELARVVWPAVSFPLLAFVAVVLLQLRRLAPPHIGRLLTVALVMLSAAIVAEGAWASFYLSGGELETWPDSVEVAVEEALELAAWILIAGSLVALSASRLLAAHARALNGHRGPA